MRLVSFLQEGFPWQVEACEGESSFGFVEEIIKMMETTYEALTLLESFSIFSEQGLLQV